MQRGQKKFPLSPMWEEHSQIIGLSPDNRNWFKKNMACCWLSESKATMPLSLLSLYATASDKEKGDTWVKTCFIAFTIAEACSSTVALGEQDMKFIKYSWASNFLGIPAWVMQYIQCLFHCFETLPETSSCHIRSWTQYTGSPFDFARHGLGIWSSSVVSFPNKQCNISGAKKGYAKESIPINRIGFRLLFLSSG